MKSGVTSDTRSRRLLKSSRIGPLGCGNRFLVFTLFLEHLALHCRFLLHTFVLAMARHLSYLMARNNVQKQQVSNFLVITDYDVSTPCCSG